MSIQSNLDELRSDPIYRVLLEEALDQAHPYTPRRIRKSGSRPVDEEEQMFRKVWQSRQGADVKRRVFDRTGDKAGMDDAMRLFFHEIWKGRKND